MRRSIHSKSICGQATMEFLIFLPLLMAVIVLIAYSGWWGYARLSAQNFLYASCTGISRSRSYLTVSPRGYESALRTRPFWEYESVTVPVEQASRLGAKGCHSMLRNMIAEDANGFWQFQDLAEAHGFALFPPFMSCDGGLCR